ncbi:hypothetical protein [Neomicrococcus lactis]|uniref:Uncharacterized protein n=1 Tax=Neomicrococcus lactis TaxID=732241 RepID=A0A7W8YB17_9MICC|nr:hypothetical protein [Neomicrococcus lactis]MBB5598211.1 hypothetical protein [Neomicrococcus lactis]
MGLPVRYIVGVSNPDPIDSPRPAKSFRNALIPETIDDPNSYLLVPAQPQRIFKQCKKLARDANDQERAFSRVLSLVARNPGFGPEESGDRLPRWNRDELR